MQDHEFVLLQAGAIVPSRMFQSNRLAGAFGLVWDRG
jgi:hypothetical protein